MTRSRYGSTTHKKRETARTKKKVVGSLKRGLIAFKKSVASDKNKKIVKDATKKAAKQIKETTKKAAGWSVNIAEHMAGTSLRDDPMGFDLYTPKKKKTSSAMMKTVRKQSRR